MGRRGQVPSALAPAVVVGVQVLGQAALVVMGVTAAWPAAAAVVVQA